MKNKFYFHVIYRVIDVTGDPSFPKYLEHHNPSVPSHARLQPSGPHLCHERVDDAGQGAAAARVLRRRTDHLAGAARGAPLVGRGGGRRRRLGGRLHSRRHGPALLQLGVPAGPPVLPGLPVLPPVLAVLQMGLGARPAVRLGVGLGHGAPVVHVRLGARAAVLGRGRRRRGGSRLPERVWVL